MSEQNRYLCQFRDVGKDYFVTDCAFPTLDQAARYVNRIVGALDSVAEGQVYDSFAQWIVCGPTDYKPQGVTK